MAKPQFEIVEERDEAVKPSAFPTAALLLALRTMLSALRYVDHVCSFEEDTPLELIRALRPTVIVKGGDYKVSEVVGKEIAPVLLVPY
mgnify:CR=1 FL=1